MKALSNVLPLMWGSVGVGGEVSGWVGVIPPEYTLFCYLNPANGQAKVMSGRCGAAETPDQHVQYVAC